ncbi:YchJ family protein [Aliidiomarina haloalkalitolerans]|uniref:UPF0225 protein CWE06_05085 n=1 Tax=Aliidiomarina haloalkalitolerans TaxID=859059 RepID=A0A432VVV7_9GAMM|nr:YchJ family metal-binding protein [Aliidiomarina haloalkalitolerans]RUO20683.1 Zn-binding protein [Aliidiomarina haloalkalitolerans]
MQSKPCPCGLSQNYSACCGRLHNGAQATTPEQLMRSRFSAFALGLTDYLLATWHPRTRPSLDLNDNPQWVKLEVIDSWQRDDNGFVHFRAYYRIGGELGILEEKSDFVLENDQWFYLQGDYGA